MQALVSPQVSPVTSLRSRGLRITRPRLAVLDVLAQGGHHDADSVRRQIQEGHAEVSVQAVYDVLACLVDHGLAHRLEPAGLPTLYEQRVGDNHHHLVCRECRVVVDVDCVHGPAPCLNPDDNQGFVVDEAEVTYWGHCPDCQTATPDHGGHA